MIVVPLIISCLCFLSCERPSRTPLPSLVSIVAKLKPGGYVSLLVGLNAPRRRPTLMVSPGFVVFDGNDIIDFSLFPRVTQSGGTVTDIRIERLMAGTVVELRIAPSNAREGDLDVQRVLDGKVVVRGFGWGWERWVELDTSDAQTREVEALEPAVHFSAAGPDQGFNLLVKEGRLLLKLPHDRGKEGLPIMDQVERIVSVKWIPKEDISDYEKSLLDKRFKMAGSMIARAQGCTVDGDLSEWSRDKALAVSSENQLQSGYERWEGFRDAGFAVATRLSESAICAAIRVRDENIIPGKDTIEVQVGDNDLLFPVPESRNSISREGVEAAFTGQVSLGVGLELCIGNSLWEPVDGIVPFRVLYHDYDDGDQEPVIMATAPEVPWPTLAGVKMPRQRQEAVLPLK